MSKARASTERVLIGEARERLEALRSIHAGLSAKRRKDLLKDMDAVLALMRELRDEADTISDPGPLFDPADPDTIGRLVTLALLVQPRVPLKAIGNSYGSGVYAIYYNGDNVLYAPISGTETPLYIGKADPPAGARDAREQGPALSRRLKEHRGAIAKVEKFATEQALGDTLQVADFDCRRLVCTTNAQLLAERHLIRIFRPVWNSEMRIAYGISKHGDSAKMRGHGRSPFDVLHPGRSWAGESETDQLPRERIVELLASHFAKHPARRSTEELVAAVLDGLIQTGAASSTDVEELEIVEAVQATLDGLEPFPE